ncbi:serine hydrolase domain-containing protein [Lysinibacillus sphaericus]|uniref:Beta-lactamase-related domain-containing protein n=1 Tax=Lysinibacillus sphaericus OT4b.31 TaxID=1285586 RepID=R7Z8W5_LYSSH|nr:serine hydrolase domain-containing protein [Lysinibacillus sphaericus]EON70572.1 hypothetical protein H131_21057 [Lysinibacillus sphaericus OT4b.31]
MKQATMMEEFKQYAGEITKKYQIPGFAMGLAKDGQLFYEKGLGYRNVEKELPLSSDTVFGIGSITKSFTCVAILQLQEAGKLSVHDAVINYLPEFKTNNEDYTKQMTIHHFMTHTAGLPPLQTLMGALRNSIELDPKFEEDKKKENEPSKRPSIDTYEELMEDIANAEFQLLGAPGTEFSYSNDCYALLGTIIERVSGIKYEQYMKDYILDPAGMYQSVFHLEELNGHEDIATLYDSRGKAEKTIVFESNNPWDAPAMRAAGFLKSTINDMLKYAEIFRNNGKVGSAQILTPKSVELMTTPYIQCDPEKYYGYGLIIIPDFFGYQLIEHGGSIKGVAAQLNMIPELGLTGISLANLAGVPSTQLLYSAFAQQLGKSVHDTHFSLKEMDISLVKLKEYEGEFVSGEGSQVKLHVEAGKLHMNFDGIQTIIKAIAEDTFLVQVMDSNLMLRFKRDEDGTIVRIKFGYRQIPKVK